MCQMFYICRFGVFWDPKGDLFPDQWYENKRKAPWLGTGWIAQISIVIYSVTNLIVISFQGGIFHPNRPVFHLMIFYWLDTLQLKQEKKKSSVAQCSTGWFKKYFLECIRYITKGIKSDVNIPVMWNRFVRQCPHTLGIFPALYMLFSYMYKSNDEIYQK